MKLLLALVVCLCVIAFPNSIHAAGGAGTPAPFAEEFLDFLVSSIDSLNIDGIPKPKGGNKNGASSNTRLACVTKDQRDYITSAMEACKKYMKSQKALDEEEIYFLSLGCLLEGITGLNQSTGLVNTTKLKADVIGGTSLSKDNKTAAEKELEKCLKEDMNVPKTLVQLLLEDTELVYEVIDAWLFSMMNGHDRVQTTDEVEASKYFVNLYIQMKSLLCITESLLKNGCSSASTTSRKG